MDELLKSFVVLLAVMDPIGSVPIFMEATKQFDDKTKRKVAANATLISGGILIFFIILGQIIIEAMHISLNAFQVSGGIILFLFALTMVFGEHKADEQVHKLKDFSHVTVFPIAIPGIASPGAIMSVVLLTDNHVYPILHQVITTLIVIFLLILIYYLLRFAKKIQDFIGENGVSVISRIMGLIIAAVAVESVMAGIKSYFSIK